MLRTLTVHDFVIVDSLELDFASGFSALTGETGAGKSILIDALHLTLGGRGDSGMIREGAGKADICAEFSVSDAIVEWLRTNDIECEEDSVLMRRTIDCSGRSRGFVNGVSVTTSQMRELAALLIDIHGQNAHQSLLKADEQRNLLDRHAGLEQDVEKLAALYKVWQSLLVKIHEAETDSEKRQAEKERLEWQVGELERLGPKAGEWELVNNDYDRLSHAASLIEGAGETLNELSESDSPVLSRLGVLVQKLSRLADIDDKLRRLSSCSNRHESSFRKRLTGSGITCRVPISIRRCFKRLRNVLKRFIRQRVNSRFSRNHCLKNWKTGKICCCDMKNRPVLRNCGNRKFTQGMSISVWQKVFLQNAGRLEKNWATLLPLLWKTCICPEGVLPRRDQCRGRACLWYGSGGVSGCRACRDKFAAFGESRIGRRTCPYFSCHFCHCIASDCYADFDIRRSRFRCRRGSGGSCRPIAETAWERTSGFVCHSFAAGRQSGDAAFSRQ